MYEHLQSYTSYDIRFAIFRWIKLLPFIVVEATSIKGAQFDCNVFVMGSPVIVLRLHRDTAFTSEKLTFKKYFFEKSIFFL